ncbi:MAG: recombinase family protein [Clostridia bacterium]|nr:recombinase family protein [Clostridia bacterium]
MAPLKCKKNEPTEWIAGIYLRVSTFDQAREGHSYEEQEKDLRKLCERREFKIYAVYGDPGVSGKKYEQRKSFQNLLEDIRTGKINVVVVWRQDRLVRGVANTQKLIDEAKKYDCKIVTSWNDLDYKTAVGKYQINMEAAHSEYELDVISERTRLGLIGAYEKGNFPNIPFGYTRDKLSATPKKTIIDEENAPYVRRIFELYLQGNSARQVMEIINEEYPGTKKFTRSGIEKMVHNEFYAGVYHCKFLEEETGEICTYEAPAIIDKQTWNELKEQYHKNQMHNRRKQTYIFMQKIKCPCCGHDVLGGTNGKGKSGKKFCYYICTRCGGAGYVPEPLVEEAFVKELNEILDYFMIADVGTIPISNQTQITENEEKYNKMLEELEKRESRVKKSYFDGYISESDFQEEMRYTALKKDHIHNEIKKKVKRDVRITEDMDITLYSTIKEIQKRQSDLYYSQASDIWNQLDKEQKRIIVADYIDQIEIKYDVKKKEVTITNIKFREQKIFNLAFMMKEQLMDMTIKKDGKNILVSQTKTKKEITDFITELQKYYKVKTIEVSIDDIVFENMDANRIVKIMPIKNTTTYKKQKYTIITI